MNRGLGPQASSLVRSARHGDDPTSADQERVRAALAVKLAAASAAAASTTGSASAAAASGAASPGAGLLSAGLVKASVGLAVLGLVGASVVHEVRVLSRPAVPVPSASLVAPVSAPSGSPTPATPASAEAPTVDSPAAPEPAPSAIVVDMKARPQPTAAPRTTGSVSPGPHPIEAENQLMQQAQHALRDGDPQQALKLLEQHAAQHPTGQLSAERSAARVIALCRAGRRREGLAEAASFARRYPSSPLLARVRMACQTGDSPSSP